MDLQDRLWPVLHRAMSQHARVYRLTRGRVGARFPGRGPAFCLLDHVGAKSGKERTTALLYVRDGDDVVVIASKGGYPKHPAWFHNLKANPTATVQVGPRRWKVRARVSEGEERARLWKKSVAGYRPYDDYQARTDRQIPVVVLEPLLQ